MNRKAVSLFALAVIASGLVLALTGCELIDEEMGKDLVDSAFPMYITYVNYSDGADLPTIFVFAKNAIPGFDELEDGIAWRVLPDIAKGSSSEFTVLPTCTVRASWGGVNRTESLVAEPGQRYAVVEDDTGIVLLHVGSASQPNVIEVTSEVQVTGGITAHLLNDGKLLMQESIVAYGQKATFVLERKLYWGLASEIQESQLIRSAVLDSLDFFEQDLSGVTGATVTLTGDWRSGYLFEVTND